MMQVLALCRGAHAATLERTHNASPTPKEQACPCTGGRVGFEGGVGTDKHEQAEGIQEDRRLHFRTKNEPRMRSCLEKKHLTSPPANQRGRLRGRMTSASDPGALGAD